MNLKCDLFGIEIRKPKKKKEKGLGHLNKLELIAEVRKVFPNAAVTSGRVIPKPDPEIRFIPDCVIRIHRGHGRRDSSLSPEESKHMSKTERFIFNELPELTP
jgi:hypothetical protein